MRQWRTVGGFESMQDQVIESDALLPEAPGEILRRDLCAGSLLDFIDEVIARAFTEGGGVQIGRNRADQRQDCNNEAAEDSKNPAFIQEPQFCSFCGSLRAICPPRDP